MFIRLLQEPGSHDIHFNSANTSGNSEERNSTVKKRDVFRPSVFDRITSHRDQWCNDDTGLNSDSHRDRLREMEKEHSDMNKAEQHCDDPKQYLDSHVSPKERWVRSPSDERNHDQRRDNNRNSRWGPTSKGSENWRERSTDSDRKDDAPSERVCHGKEKEGSNPEKGNERDNNVSRSWNSSYFASRGAGGTSDHLSPDPQKLSASFGYSSYKQESHNQNSTSSRREFTSVTSRVSSRSSRPFHLGVLSDRPGASSRNSVRYSRIKLFEIYRTTDVRNFVMPIDDNEEISSLWQEDPMDPLALIAPNAEEVVIFTFILSLLA